MTSQLQALLWGGLLRPGCSPRLAAAFGCTPAPGAAHSSGVRRSPARRSTALAAQKEPRCAGAVRHGAACWRFRSFPSRLRALGCRANGTCLERGVPSAAPARASSRWLGVACGVELAPDSAAPGVARRSGWEDGDNQDENSGVAVSHPVCRAAAWPQRRLHRGVGIPKSRLWACAAEYLGDDNTFRTLRPH